MDQIKTLRDLFESGALSKEEYEAKKKQLFQSQINLNSSTESLGENCSPWADFLSCEFNSLDKQELTQQISNLSGEALRDVFHIIQQSQPDLLQEQVRNEGDDFSFNVDSFSAETWLALRNYVAVFQQMQVQPSEEEQFQLQQIFDQMETTQQVDIFQEITPELPSEEELKDFILHSPNESAFFSSSDQDTHASHIFPRKRNLDLIEAELPENSKKIRTQSPPSSFYSNSENENSMSLQDLLTLDQVNYDEETSKLLKTIFSSQKNQMNPKEAGLHLGDLKPALHLSHHHDYNNEDDEDKNTITVKEDSTSNNKCLVQQQQQDLSADPTLHAPPSENGKFKIKVIIYRIEKTCDGPYPYKCDNCGKRFSDSSNLLKHIRTHTKEKPYVCTVEGCKKEFSHSTSLKEHMNTHSGNKPHQCPFPGCGMEFAHLSNLRRHSRIHTKDKPYVCNLCDHKFTQSSNWKKHLTQVHKLDKSQIQLPHGSTSKLKEE